MIMRATWLISCAFVGTFWYTETFAQTIAAGGYHSLAICTDGSVRSWGNNGIGELGNGAYASMNLPVAVTGLTDVVMLAPGLGANSFAMSSDGTLWGWGNNASGQFGMGDQESSPVPVQIPIEGVIKLWHSYGHTLLVMDDGTVRATGGNGYGELGSDSTGIITSFVQVDGVEQAIAVAGGWGHSIALLEGGTVKAWGSGIYGELGNGDNVNSPLPVNVIGLSDVVAITSGRAHALALRSDGTVWAWGWNVYGELGNGTNTNSNVPLQVNGMDDVAAIAAGQYFSLALKNDGTVWAWGQNNYGMHGNGTNTDSNEPVQVSSLNDVVAIAAGEFHALALRNDGTVWAWGYNSSGALGNNSFIESNVPVQVQDLCVVTTSIQEESTATSIEVFPNPSTGKFVLRTLEGVNDTIMIRDLFGREIRQVKAREMLTEIDLSDRPTGVYMLTTGSGSARLIKE